MKVLWLCNLPLPACAAQLGIEASNKEGWVSGMAEAVLTIRFRCPGTGFPRERTSAAEPHGQGKRKFLVTDSRKTWAMRKNMTKGWNRP